MLGRGRSAPRRPLAALALLAPLLCGCGTTHPHTLVSGIPRTRLDQTRPVGAGARFSPPATGTVIGGCTSALGERSATHVEVFAANRVVILAAGIGVRAPSTPSAGRIAHARCYGDLVTLEPTGVVLVRPGVHPVLSQLFHAWGQPLSRWQLASFRAAPGTHVSVFVDGRRWHGSPGSVPLTTHAEVVLEVGSYVPPHTSFTFPPGA